MIIVEPHSGLANRIRVLASAYAISRELGQSLRIIWRQDQGLNCRFDDLFGVNDGIYVISRSYLSFFKRFFNKPITGSIIRKIFGVGFYFDDSMCKDLLWINYSGLDMKYLTPDINYFFTCHDFAANPDYSCVKPLPHIMNKVNEFISFIGKPFIGVHIRRTDNSFSIEKSPTKLFRDKINERLSENSNSMFYLASDDEQLKHDFVAYFPRNIVIRKSTLARNSKEGIIDAYIELLILSKSNEIWGSYFSSFSDVASYLNGVKQIKIMSWK